MDPETKFIADQRRPSSLNPRNYNNQIIDDGYDKDGIQYVWDPKHILVYDQTGKYIHKIEQKDIQQRIKNEGSFQLKDRINRVRYGGPFDAKKGVIDDLDDSDIRSPLASASAVQPIHHFELRNQGRFEIYEDRFLYPSKGNSESKLIGLIPNAQEGGGRGWRKYNQVSSDDFGGFTYSQPNNERCQKCTQVGYHDHLNINNYRIPKNKKTKPVRNPNGGVNNGRNGGQSFYRVFNYDYHGH